MSNFTDAELSALRQAYASGTLSVSYNGRTVTYDGEAGLKRRIRELENDMGVRDRPRMGVAGFSRGY